MINRYFFHSIFSFLMGFIVFCLPTSIFSADHNILDYGAKPDGKTLNTTFIQAAIDSAHHQGRGRVIIPEGVFLSGTILLKSGVELHLLKNAVLLGSTNSAHYLKLSRWKGLVMAEGQNNLAITGEGLIDGQGRALALGIDSLFYAGQLESRHYDFKNKRPKERMRPQCIEMVRCKNIRISGITIKNAASWVQTYELCENLVIDNIRVESDAYWNNDGMDIGDCKNVRITNCYVDTADDGICLKSHFSEHFNDSIYIADCQVRTSASAVKFGTASKGGFKNVVVKNIKVFDTFRSAIALEAVDGGTLENVLVDGIEASNTGNAVFIRLGHRNTKGEVGQVRNITIKNIKVEVCFERPDYRYDIRGPDLPFFHNIFPSSITGIPGHFVENVHLENIEIIYPGRGNDGLAIVPLYRLNDVPEKKSDYPEFSMFGELPAWGFYVRHVRNLSMKNIKIKTLEPDFRPPMVFDDVKQLRIEQLEVEGEKKKDWIILKEVEKTTIEKKHKVNIIKE